MGSILVTGGTVFVSRYVAAYFAGIGDQVYVLNRNTKPQLPGVTLIEGDRNNLGDKLKDHHFDAVLDITAYTRSDVKNLIDALGSVKDYVFLSSSAVYPETLPRPFRERQPCGPNSIWGAYGINKLEAEQYLTAHVSQAYILRPPYLYGPMQNLYREPFVFDCAEAERPFFIPGDGGMHLQFFHVRDLCRLIQILLERKPETHVFNVGNPDTVTIADWVKLCYQVVGKKADMVSVDASHAQRSYFCFHDYDYELDVTEQSRLMPDTTALLDGLQESYQWYAAHRGEVNRKPYMDYIDSKIRNHF